MHTYAVGARQALLFMLFQLSGAMRGQSCVVPQTLLRPPPIGLQFDAH